MDLQDVQEKWKRKNKILFSRNSPCLQELLQHIRLQKHRTLVLWAFDCVQEPVRVLKERYPHETRPETAVALCREWARGAIKMPEAKQALLQAHAVAKELRNPADIALCHAVGQACATVHVETHAIGLPIYELTAVALENGIDQPARLAQVEKAVAAKIDAYIRRLDACAQTIQAQQGEWAGFLLDDSRPNKEFLAYQKQCARAETNRRQP